MPPPNNHTADLVPTFVTAFVTTWPSLRQQLAAEIAARAASDPRFPRHGAEIQLALLDGTLGQLARLLMWLGAP
jgi:hypothetical protein